MMFSLCQLFLFRPHLHHIRDMYAGKTVSVSESYYALGCIKVASSTILMIEKLRGHSQSPTGESWLSIYAVFSSVMCLVFLVAANPGTTLPSVAWQRACRGIRVIAANRCADNISTVCLELLKVCGRDKSTNYLLQDILTLRVVGDAVAQGNHLHRFRSHRGLHRKQLRQQGRRANHRVTLDSPRHAVLRRRHSNHASTRPSFAC